MENKFELGPIQREWVETLKAHPERQFSGLLGHINLDGTIQMCCLGQLYAIGNKIDASKPGQVLRDNGSEIFLDSYLKYGLIGPTGSFIKVKINMEDPQFLGISSLAQMNDSGFTWPQIAEFIETYPEAVFTKSV